MKRRDVLRGVAAAGAAAGLAACGAQAPAPGAAAAGGAPATALRWKMVTSWPTNFPGLGMAAARLGERITRASGGRLTVRVYGAGEIVPAFEVFDAVSRGTAEMGHSAAYYWKGKAAAAPFFCAVPFGLNAQEMNAWLRHGGGMDLWRELYARFDLVPFAAGNTGVQMAGWFRERLVDASSLRGLTMRIPGLGGEVMARVGATPVNLPGGEIFGALQSGAIDATEWVGPYNDLAFGLHRVAKHCYYPGWQEPGPTLEAMVHKPAFDALPDDLQAIVADACQAINDDMLAEYTASNQQALEQLRGEHGVEFLPLPESVLAALKQASEEVLEEVAASDPFARRVFDSQRAFQRQAQAWHAISEEAYYAARR